MYCKIPSEEISIKFIIKSDAGKPFSRFLLIPEKSQGKKASDACFLTCQCSHPLMKVHISKACCSGFYKFCKAQH